MFTNLAQGWWARSEARVAAARGVRTGASHFLPLTTTTTTPMSYEPLPWRFALLAFDDDDHHHTDGDHHNDDDDHHTDPTPHVYPFDDIDDDDDNDDDNNTDDSNTDDMNTDLPHDDDTDDNNTDDDDEAGEEMEEVQEKAEASPPAEQMVDQTGVAIGVYTATTVNDKIFEELRLSSDVALEVQHGWKAFLGAAGNREAAGETIYSALFDNTSLILQSLVIMATRFMDGLSLIIDSLSDPKGLKDVVETLGFQHLDLLITVPRVIILRDAIVGLLVAKMGPRLSQKARVGFATMLNYVGGSYIFIRQREFAIHLMITRAVAMVKQQGPLDEDLDEEGHEGGSALEEVD